MLSGLYKDMAKGQCYVDNMRIVLWLRAMPYG